MRKTVVALLCVLAGMAAYAGPPPKVLVIESYSGAYQWDASYKTGLESVIGDLATIEYFEMNTKNLPKEEHQKMADLAWTKYLSLNPDVVVLGDDAALKFLGRKFADTKTNVVYLGINNNPRNYFDQLPESITGVLERPIIKRSITFISEIIPSAKRGLVLFDTDVTATIVKTEVFAGKDSENLVNTTVDIKLVDTFARWKDLVSSAKGKYDFLILGLYQTVRDEKGAIVSSAEIARWTSDNSKVPVFGFWDFNVGKAAAIGGLVLFGKDTGTHAGVMVKDILNGKKPSEIAPVNDTQGVFLFSRSQLNKWRMTLPASIKDKAVYVD